MGDGNGKVVINLSTGLEVTFAFLVGGERLPLLGRREAAATRGFEDVAHLVGGLAAWRAHLAERERAWGGMPEASVERYQERVRGT